MKNRQASSTAYSVVQGFLYTAQKPQYKHLVSDETVDACQQILQATDEGKKRLKALEHFFLRFMLLAMERFLAPGIALHYVLRKRFIEDCVQKTITQGATQIVNIGAGFDTLALRLYKQHEHVNFIEVDHPATNSMKTESLVNTQKKNSNLHFIPINLTQESLESSLGRFTGFDAQRETMYICEGVLMYLEEKDITILLNTLKKLTDKKPLFIFSCIEPMASNNNNVSHLLKLYLKSQKEMLKWYIESTALSSFLNLHGYNLKELATTDTLKSLYLDENDNTKLHRGEYFAIAQSDL